MPINKILNTLKHSPLGETLTDEHLGVLTEIAEIKTLKNGEYLAIEGDEDGYLYIIMSGTLKDLKKMPDGEPEILCRLMENELAGISGFVDHQKRLADMQAVGDTEVIAISRDKFRQLTNAQPEAVYKVMCALVRESLEIVKRLDDNIVELNEYFKKVNRYY